MSTFRRIRPAPIVGAFLAVALSVGLPSSARGQGDLVGSRGGLTAPAIPTAPTQPLLPPTLNLPPAATSSLLNGLNASGTALRPGMGWLVSDLTHQGIHGPQLADVIHQLKPYKQRGVLTFPQVTQQGGTAPSGLTRPPQNGGTFPQHGGSQGGFGGGFGKGKKR